MYLFLERINNIIEHKVIFIRLSRVDYSPEELAKQMEDILNALSLEKWVLKKIIEG